MEHSPTTVYEFSHSSASKSEQSPIKLSEYLPTSNLFSFMNKEIEEAEPSTSEDQQPLIKSPIKVTKQQQVVVVPKPKRTWQPIKQVPTSKVSSEFADFERQLMEPIELLQVTDQYEHLISREKRQAKRDKMLRKQRQRQLRSQRHTSADMQVVFNAVCSYFN